MADYLRESGVKWLWEKIKTLLSAKQDKLVSGSNIKTINGTSVLGSGDITIEGGGDASGSVDEGRLVWSSEDSPSTLMDIAYLNGNGNKIAGIPPSLVTIEYSADNGATWVDSGISDANKTRLTNHRINGDTYIRPNGSTTLDINYQTRITIDLIEDNATNAWVGCFEFRKIILKCSGIQRYDTHTLTIEMQKYGSTTWDIIKTSRFWGSPGFFSIPTPKRTVGYPSSSYYRKVRLTWQTGDVYTNVASINGVYFISDNIVGVGGGKKPSQYAITGTPYSIDYDQNTIFPNAIKGKKLITDGGKSSQVVKGDGSLEEENALAVASAIDAEHAQEADYAGVADKADKLTNARTISLSGGATSKAVAFDGSKNIDIPVRTLEDLSLTRVYKSDGRADALSLADLASPIFASNRLAFNNPNSILIYKSNDGGTTWDDYGATDEQKTKFVSGIDQPIYIGGKTTGQVAVQDRLRVILTSNRYAYTSIEEFLFYVTTAGAEGAQCRLSYITSSGFNAALDYNSQTYTEITTKQVIGWSGWNRLLQTYSNAFGYDSSNNIKAFMFEFWFERTRSGYESKTRFCISQLIGIGKNVYSNNTGCEMMNNGHLYSYDWQKNATFPARIDPNTTNAQDLGSTSKYWRNIYGNKFITKGGTNQQVVLGDGSLKALSEISPITDADADILLDNHIHNIDVYANGNIVNISVIESSKNGNSWETEDNDIPIPLATATSAGVMSKEDKSKLDIIELAGSEGIYHELRITDDQEATLMSTNTTGSTRVFMTAYSESAENIVQYNKGGISNYAYIAADANGSTCQGGDSNQFILNAPSSSDECPTLTLIKDNEPFIYTDNNGITSPKFITTGGTSNQVVLGNGELLNISEISGSGGSSDNGYNQFIDVMNDSNACPIIPSENFFNNANWTDIPEENKATLDFMNEDAKTLYYDGEKWVEDGMAATALHIPYANNTTSGLMSAADKQKLDALGMGAVGVPETLNCNTTYVEELADGDTLSITGFVAPTTLFGNYTVHLKTSTNNSISLPSILFWPNGEQPVFEDNTCYELSITATLFDAEYVYKAVLVAFK